MPRPSRLTAIAAVAALAVGAATLAVALRPPRPADADLQDPAAAPAVSDPATPAAAQPAGPGRRPHVYGRVLVVAVGINDYPKLDGTGSLKFAENDAAEFGRLMADRYGYEVRLLLGSKGDATRRRIERALLDAERELGEDDALIVFFSGHGQVVPLPGSGEAGYLVPADADLDYKSTRDPRTWAEQCVEMRLLTEVSERTRARHVVLLVDACRSGYLTKQKGALANWDLKSLLFGKSRAAMTATKLDQSAREDEGAGHGYFTAALLEQLRAADCVGVDEVYLPVRRAVNNRTTGQMFPQFRTFGDGDGMFVFIPLDTDPEQIRADLAGVAAAGPADARGLKGVAARARDRQADRTTYEQFLECVHTHDDLGYPAGVERQRKWKQRFERFRENADAGDLWAMAALHYCYSRGLGTPKDPAAALAWARRADEFRKPAGVGRFLLGRCHQLGLGLDGKSPELSRRAAGDLFAESAAAGFPLGAWAAARVALAGDPTGDEARRVREWAAQAAEGGLALGEVVLAGLYATGKAEHPRDSARARALYESAARKNCPDAKWNLSRLLTARGGQTPPADRTQARQLMFEAADAGEPLALTTLAAEFLQAANERPYLVLGLDRDEREARLLMDRAAAQGFGPAVNGVYKYYSQGIGGPVDLKTARERLDAAVARDDAWAHFEQGNEYLNGGGAYEKSFEKAFAAFSRAAAKGHPVGCIMLALMYDAGQGFPTNRRPGEMFYPEVHLTMHWFTKALVLDAAGDAKLEPQFPKLFARARDRLKSFRSMVPLDSDAKDADDRWREQFPDTYKARP